MIGFKKKKNKPKENKTKAQNHLQSKKDKETPTNSVDINMHSLILACARQRSP